MKIIYLFTVYKNASIVKHTIEKLQSPNSAFYIHIDLASREDFSSLLQVDNVHFIGRRHYTPWGEIGLITAVVASLKEIVEAEPEAGYVCLMSESDYPVKHSEYITSFLSGQQKDYIVATPLPSNNPMHIKGHNWAEGGMRRINCYALKITPRQIATIEPRTMNYGNLRQLAKILIHAPRKLPSALKIWKTYPYRSHPPYLKPCAGDVWFILRISTIKKVLRFTDVHKDYLEYLKDSACADELFMPTLVNHIIPAKERVDNTLRYIKWPANRASPDNISIEDSMLLAEKINDNNTLFVRKVEDMEVCRIIDRLQIASPSVNNPRK